MINFNNIALGQYIPGNSFMHRLDPRTKLAAVFILMAAVFFLDSPKTLLICAAFPLILASCAGLSVKFMLKSLRIILLFAVFSFIFNAFLTNGEPMFSLWGLSITYEGAERGLIMALRLFILVLTTSLLSFTTSSIMLTDGMEKILSPGKCIGIPAHELAMVCIIALRFVPTLGQEANNITKAQLARGASLDRGSIIQRAKAIFPIIIPLFISAFRHAEDLASAMEARCYRGGEGRTRLRELRFKSLDLAAFIIVIMFLVLLKASENYHCYFSLYNTVYIH